MDGTMRPVGILLAIVGNVMVAIAFPVVVGGFESLDERALLRYIPMLVVGFAFASLAIRFGGARLAFYATFLSIGLGSLWSAFTSDDPFDRTFGFLFGGIFVAVTVLNLGGRLLVRSMGSVFPVASAGGGGLTPDMLTMALGQLETLHAQGQLTDAQLTAAKASLSGAAPTGQSVHISHPEALGQLDALHAQGFITDDQLKTVKLWWGTQPEASPPSPAAGQGQPAPGTPT
jgi:hypothetical protein